MKLYNDTCFECSKLITIRYSSSFSRGIRAFEKRFRYPVYAIYGFVRCADEIVDTFHEHEQRQLIDEFRDQCFKAIKDQVSLNPVLQAFQLVVNTYGIEAELIAAFFCSMGMDLHQKAYDADQYKAYIYGSAEVIGLMCLRIFCENDGQRYRSLLPSACALGSAFQKINFLRDICADYHERGRIYFPGVDFNNFTLQDKEQIEQEIRDDFASGLKGIRLLPKGAGLGVYVAYRYYLELLNKISKMPAEMIVKKRIRIRTADKTVLYLKAVLKYKLTGLD